MLCIHYSWFCWVTRKKNLLEILNVISLEIIVFLYSVVTFLIINRRNYTMVIIIKGLEDKFLPIFAGIPL